jgi:FkbM family methyltransferase
MFKSLKYYQSINKRFGPGALRFLISSKFVKNKLGPRYIPGIEHPVYLSNYNVDVLTLFQIFFGKEYEVSLKSNPTFIIDCGANIGLSAIYYAHNFPNAKIIAIEPDKGNFKFLEKNTTLYKNVVCLNKAIWPYSAQMEVIDTGRGNWGLQTKEATTKSVEIIEGISISEILREYNQDKIDLLKIDIEGAEKELFGSNYETWLPQTKIIIIELHDFLEEGISDTFYKALEGLTYNSYCKGENIVFEFL